MERNSFRLRVLLLEIDRKLTHDDRRKLCILIGCQDTPRRLLDIVHKDDAASMTNIWETLLDRRKITIDNVDYLIERLEKIERPDLAQLLKDYISMSFSLSTVPYREPVNQTQKQSNELSLFSRIDP